MNDNNYIVIQGWMCNILHLTGNELLIFALIYGFSQDGESEFNGSRSYIANTFNITKPTVDKSLRSLIDKGLLTKHTVLINDIQSNRYKVSLEGVKKFYGGSKEILPPSKKTLQGGGKKTLPYKYNNNNSNNKDNIYRKIPPTIEQVKEYCRERKNNIDPEKFVDFYESKGWMVGKTKMKDWSACVRTWEKTQKEDNKTDGIQSNDSEKNLNDLKDFWEDNL